MVESEDGEVAFTETRSKAGRFPGSRTAVGRGVFFQARLRAMPVDPDSGTVCRSEWVEASKQAQYGGQVQSRIVIPLSHGWKEVGFTQRRFSGSRCPWW